MGKKLVPFFSIPLGPITISNLHKTSRETTTPRHFIIINMGRRPADTNPALIEPDYEASQSQTKKPRLTKSETTAMAALLSFRAADPQEEGSNVEPNAKVHTVVLKTSKKLAADAGNLSNVTDDEESICSRQSQTAFSPLPGKPLLVMGGSPPPLRMALVKPMLPSFKTQRQFPTKLPQGRPLRAAPGIAKHLVKQTKPICLKLSP